MACEIKVMQRLFDCHVRMEGCPAHPLKHRDSHLGVHYPLVRVNIDLNVMRQSSHDARDFVGVSVEKGFGVPVLAQL